ncbi:hypothetical protein BN873_1020005 [Candidatus Competibacter denitrificans Run_A_D11]|uniref:Uncharacterized protein n=1 Tax=Candidatus Competibacter denitrificans Run_A_D11 TaxID=1400863 RepID=W6M3P5_9GAMM|nr:hypothetical protein BN873_1020005 [Candidatus Competibacter denitrificans Run_A_D11]
MGAATFRTLWIATRLGAIHTTADAESRTPAGL